MKNYESEECCENRAIIRSTEDIKIVYEVLYDYSPSFCESCIIDADSEHGLIRIRLPYKDANGKRISMYCNPGRNEDFLFTDDGYFLEELEKIGIHKFINGPLTIHIKTSNNFARCFDFYLNIFRRIYSIINRASEESFHALSEELEDKCIKLKQELMDLNKEYKETRKRYKVEIQDRDKYIRELEKEIHNLKKKKKLFRIRPIANRSIYIEFNGYQKQHGLLKYADMPAYIVDMNLPQSQINRSFICPDTGNLCLGSVDLFLTPDQIWYILFEK